MPGFEDRPPLGPRRTKSLPSKYMIPSEDMGEYESGDPNRRRSAPPQSKVTKNQIYYSIKEHFEKNLSKEYGS